MPQAVLQHEPLDACQGFVGIKSLETVMSHVSHVQSRQVDHSCLIASSLTVMSAGSGMQQQAFKAQPAMPMPMQAPSSQLPQATPPAQATHSPFPLHHQSASKPAQSPSRSPATSATAASAALQPPTASQTPFPQPSSMAQQPEDHRAGDPGMGGPYSIGAAAGQAANPHGRGSVQHLNPYAAFPDNMQRPMFSSNANPRMTSFASGSAMPMNMRNGVRPEESRGVSGSPAGLDRPQAHENSNGHQAVGNSSSAAVAQTEKSEPTQGSSAAAVVPSGSSAAAAAEGESQHGGPCSDEVLVQMPNKAQLHGTAAADGSDKGPDADRNVTGNIEPQSGVAESGASDIRVLEDATELIEPQILAGGQTISHSLLAD